jgi:polysaccharide biosynthesis/export protein
VSSAFIGVALAGLAPLIGCRPDVAGRPLPSPVVEYEGQELDQKTLKMLLEPNTAVYGSSEPGGAEAFPDGEAYRVGPGDSLTLAVYGHPELSLVTYTGTISSGGGRPPTGLLVDNDGTSQLPLIGTVNVAGKTVAELRAYLEQELGKYIKEPKVTVQVAYNGSIRYYLMGQFQSPGMKVSDRPLRLLEAMALGGSVSLEKASLRTAYVARGGKRLPINFYRLVRDGDLTQNIKLLPGDIVMVPDNTAEQVFVFGASAATRSAQVPFLNSRLSIVQALAAAGFGFRERFQSRLSKVRVIRSDGAKGELFVVNVSAILAGDAAPFPLVPGDVIVVPPTGFTNWNLALEQVLPSIQTVGGVLQPFVQIRYLQNN